MKKFRRSIVAFLLACILGVSLVPGSVLAGAGFGDGEVYDTHVNVNGEVIELKNFYNNHGIYIYNMPQLCGLWVMKSFIMEKPIV